MTLRAIPRSKSYKVLKEKFNGSCAFWLLFVFTCFCTVFSIEKKAWGGHAMVSVGIPYSFYRSLVVRLAKGIHSDSGTRLPRLEHSPCQ